MYSVRISNLLDSASGFIAMSSVYFLSPPESSLKIVTLSHDYSFLPTVFPAKFWVQEQLTELNLKAIPLDAWKPSWVPGPLLWKWRYSWFWEETGLSIQNGFTKIQIIPSVSFLYCHSIPKETEAEDLQRPSSIKNLSVMGEIYNLKFSRDCIYSFLTCNYFKKSKLAL